MESVVVVPLTTRSPLIVALPPIVALPVVESVAPETAPVADTLPPDTAPVALTVLPDTAPVELTPPLTVKSAVSPSVPTVTALLKSFVPVHVLLSASSPDIALATFVLVA